MALSVFDLVSRIRDRLDDHGGDRPNAADGRPAWVADDVPCLWKNAELLAHLTETVREVGVREPLADDRDRIAIRPGTRLYRLPAHVLEVMRARRWTDGQPLIRATLEEMEQIDRAYSLQREWRGHDWRDAEADAPSHYLTDERAGYFSIYPQPKVALSVRLYVWRTYRFDECGPLSWCSELPDELPDTELIRDALVAGVCARAYLKRDADTSDRQLANDYEAEFTARIGARRSLHAVKSAARWGGAVARFIPNTRIL